MANLTVVVDDHVLKRARIRALEQGTSVNAVLRAYLEAWAGEAPLRDAVEEVLAIARASKSASARPWTREDLHER